MAGLGPRGFGAMPAAFACALLAGCAVPQSGPPAGDLRSARLACNAQYPQKTGNYLPHAVCVNAAVERYAVPTARHPDLIRLQEEVRWRLSEKIDRRLISPQIGERRMREADALVAEVEHDRSTGRETAAVGKIAAVEALLR